MRFKLFGVLLFILFFYASGRATAQEFSQLSGVIHIHTAFSSGHYSIEELVAKAKEKGLEVLVLTDHDLVAMEYGIFPFRNLIKKREERKSVLKLGPEKYLTEIARVNRRQQDVLVIPGVQSSPFYYWTGSFFKGNLTAHDYQKELLLIGMQAPADYRRLPLLHQGFSTRYVKELLPRCLFFGAAFFLAIYLFFQKGILRVTGGLIGIFSLFFLSNHHPFQSSRFDPYHGDQGIAPYQELIDYVNKRKGLVFWAHPESNFATTGVRLGPVKLITQKHPDDLISSHNYTGFSAIYGDNITATDPGRHWDQVLSEYCSDERARPIWGIAGADFHGKSKEEKLDTFQTIFLVRSKTIEEVFEALARGRVYAIEKGVGARLSLDQFQVQDQKGGNSAIMGEELKVHGFPVISIKLSASDSGSYPVKVSLIRRGKPIRSFEGKTPLEFKFMDQDDWGGKTFYRLDALGRGAGRLVSNPIFVVK